MEMERICSGGGSEHWTHEIAGNCGAFDLHMHFFCRLSNYPRVSGEVLLWEADGGCSCLDDRQQRQPEALQRSSGVVVPEGPEEEGQRQGGDGVDGGVALRRWG